MKWFNTYPKYSSILLINTSQFKTEINFKNKTSMSLSYLTPSYFLKSGPDSDFSDWFKQFCSFFFFFTVGLFKLDFRHIHTLHLVVMLFILYLPPNGLLSLLPSLCFCHQLPGVTGSYLMSHVLQLANCSLMVSFHLFLYFSYFL